MDKSQFGTAYFENIIRQILMGIGEDPDRDGLLETPKRVVKSWDELFSGYTKNVEDVFKTFEADGQDEMVVLKSSEIFSVCEHHMLGFSGQVHIAYIPDGKVIGISKLARLADIYARRLQIQERLTKQITDALMQYLKPKGAACVIEAAHSCLTGDSLIQLAFLDRKKFPKGVPIKDLLGIKNLNVYCYDDINNSIAIDKIKNIWATGRKQVYKVTYEWFMYNQHRKERKVGSIKVTEDHPFMLKWKNCNHYNNQNRQYENGSFLSLKEGLTIGDSLMPFSCYGENGYYTLLLNNGESVMEHRFLLEYKLGRKLESKEICHHFNEQPWDNSYDNLVLIPTKGIHNSIHLKGKIGHRKSYYPVWNKKERNILICSNCKTEYTTQFSYQEKTQKFCKRSCYLEALSANHKIISIEKIGYEDVYDLETEKYHNFAVNGIIVHNCMKMRGVNKQNSIMLTSSLTGCFKQPEVRSEFFRLIGK